MGEGRWEGRGGLGVERVFGGRSSEGVSVTGGRGGEREGDVGV